MVAKSKAGMKSHPRHHARKREGRIPRSHTRGRVYKMYRGVLQNISFDKSGKNSKQVSEVASFSIKITGCVNKGLFHRCFKGISSEFSEKLFLRTPLNRCFCLQYICFSLKTILAVAEGNCKWPWTSLSNYGN